MPKLTVLWMAYVPENGHPVFADGPLESRWGMSFPPQPNTKHQETTTALSCPQQ